MAAGHVSENHLLGFGRVDVTDFPKAIYTRAFAGDKLTTLHRVVCPPSLARCVYFARSFVSPK